MAWEIVVVALWTVAITGAITLKGISLSGKIAADKAKDDDDREIKRDTRRRQLELREENLRSVRDLIEQVTTIIDKYLIARQKGFILGDAASNTEAAAPAGDLKMARERVGPHPRWTVPDDQLDKLCRTFFEEVGNLELALAGLHLELLSNLVGIPFQANGRSVRYSRHLVDLAAL